MENLNLVIAKNLTSLRKANHLTQAELAEKLNYSDKSISKWENGEAAPSVEVLVQIGSLFGVGIDYFVQEVPPPIKNQPQKRKANKVIITTLAVLLVWLVALASYMVLSVGFGLYVWTVFIWALPVTFIVTTVFAAIWSPKRRLKVISITCLIWTLVAAIYVQLLSYNVWLLFIVAIPVQLAVILWPFIRKKV